MKDITSTTFGILIAYLLPGFTALLALSYWFEVIRSHFQTFLTTSSNVGLFLIVILVSIVLSMQITLVRWVLFEKLICRGHQLGPSDFAKIDSELKLAAFRAAVDEHYRYHQFWGSMVVVQLLIYSGWGVELVRHLNLWSGIALSSGMIGMLILTGVGAYEAFVNYVNRARKMVSGK